MEGDSSIMNELKKSICGGIAISLGTFSYLTTLSKTNNVFLSAITFYLGLCIIMVYGYNLYTEKVITLKVDTFTMDYFQKSNISNREYIVTLIKVWIGNLIGSIITTIALFQILHPDVTTIVNNKLALNPIQMLISSILCNIMVCLAVSSYKMYQNHLLSGFFITLFILCGFSHSIADMTYFTLGICEGVNIDIIKLAISIVIVSLGNAIGGLLLYYSKRR
jgi:formate/nitrite transporter FocA (FNT family)